MNVHKIKRRVLSGLFLTALLFPSCPVFADDEDEDLGKSKSSAEEVQTPTIMVTASRVVADLFELPMTVNVITAEDLKRNPVINITDALETVPGMTLVDPGLAGAKRVSIRGEDVGRTLILINGVKTVDKRNAQSGILIDASQIERIEIIKGPASVLYGPEAIGGVINIITKKGGEKPLSFSQDFILDSSTSSVDIQSAVFGNVNGFNYRFSGSGTNVGERKVPGDDGGGSADKSNYKNRYYSGQLGYDWDKGSFSIRADQYKSVVQYALGENSSNAGLFMRMPENDRQALVGTLELRDLNRYLPKLTLTGSYQNTKRNMLSDFRGMAMPTMQFIGQVKSDQDQYGFSGVSEWSFGKHYVTAGWDYEFDDVEVENNTDWVTGRMSYSKAHVEQDMIGVFVQDEWSFVDDFKLTLGARQTWVESKFIDKEGPSYAIPSNNKRKHDSLVGSAGLVYTGIDDLALRFQWSQGNRYPTVQQLFTGQAGHGGGSVTSIPNPDLKPERSNSFEVGARYQGGGWNIDGAVFYTDAKDYIANFTDNGVSSFYNAAKAETLGAELIMGYTFESTGLNPYTSVTWLRRTFTHYNGLETRKTGTPPWEGRVGLKWETDVNPTQRVFTDLYCNWAVETDNLSLGSAMSSGTVTTTPAWQTLNLTLGVEGGEDHKYNASLSLKNIGNQNYVTSRGSSNLPEPGFHIVLGVGFEY